MYLGSEPSSDAVRKQDVRTAGVGVCVGACACVRVRVCVCLALQ